MVDNLQTLRQHLLSHIDVVEGNRTVGVETVAHLSVDEGVHQITDVLFGVFGQRTGSCLYGVGHHEDSLLTGERIRSCIGKDRFINLLLRMLVLVRDIEILGLTQSVVGHNEILDLCGQVILIRQLQTFGYVIDDNLGSLLSIHLVQRVHACLVLCVEGGILDLTDVVIESTCPDKLCLCIDLVGDGCCEVAHHDGVLEGAGGYLAHLTEQILAGVRQLDKSNIRDETEHLLHDQHQRIGKEQHHTVGDEMLVHAMVHGEDTVVLHQL